MLTKQSCSPQTHQAQQFYSIEAPIVPVKKPEEYCLSVKNYNVYLN